MKKKLLSKVILLAAFSLTSVTFLAAQNIESPIKENIEWLDVWMPNSNDSGLPRILLIGNSITRGYYPEVEKALAGKAYVARLTTSKSIGDQGLLKEINLIMGYYKFDIIHFNNGLHGFGYTEKEYARAFPTVIMQIQKNAPHAKLIWATITPIRNKTNVNILDDKTERIKARNKIALDFISTQKDIKVDDLWAFTINKPELYKGGDGTHPNAAGFKLIGQKVVAALLELLDEKQ